MLEKQIITLFSKQRLEGYHSFQEHEDNFLSHRYYCKENWYIGSGDTK
ncbi:hypothetical protein [Helicobacter cinaedi]|nr:hypothetical protein [Helicobacter cinaedi]